MNKRHLTNGNEVTSNLASTPDLGQVVLTVPSPLKREDSLSLGVGGRSPLVQLVLGADTLSPTEMGALSVAVHPDDE
jgi:hypothetical protein